jgi:hypothetical protein
MSPDFIETIFSITGNGVNLSRTLKSSMAKYADKDSAVVSPMNDICIVESTTCALLQFKCTEALEDSFSLATIASLDRSTASG